MFELDRVDIKFLRVSLTNTITRLTKTQDALFHASSWKQGGFANLKIPGEPISTGDWRNRRIHMQTCRTNVDFRFK